MLRWYGGHKLFSCRYWIYGSWSKLQRILLDSLFSCTLCFVYSACKRKNLQKSTFVSVLEFVKQKMWKIILKDVCIIVFFLLYLRTLYMFVYITQNINGNVCIKTKIEQSAFYFVRWNMFYRSIHILRNENEYYQNEV